MTVSESPKGKFASNQVIIWLPRSYGFVTFESQEVAEKIIKNESETLIFKDRKLNIGHAIRKQVI